VNRRELIDKISKDTGATKKSTEAFLKSYEKNIHDALKKKGKVQLVNFGTFSVAKRAQRKGVNPQTKKPITIPAKMVSKFTPGKMLKEAVKDLRPPTPEPDKKDYPPRF
jgi:DNA-binding protein HU-beta